MSSIRFGTDGWRGIIGDDFTFENARVVAQAVADYLKEEGTADRGVVLGYDARLLSARYAEEVAAVLAGNGIKVFLANKMVATPVVSFMVTSLHAAGGLMITASHNPAHYNGIKFKGEYGGSALTEMTRSIEEKLFKHPVCSSLKQNPKIIRFNPDRDYLEHLKQIIDIQAIKQAGFKVVVDPMYGSGRGYLKNLLTQMGVKVHEIRGESNPGFGGINPEPIPPNIKPLQQAVLKYKADVGLATDGDADRLGAVDAKGGFVNPHYVYALILRHLVETRGWRGPVAKTFSTTQMIDLLGGKYQLPVYETPIGFKYICDLFLKKNLLMGGEESGGIAFRAHIPERDGILAGLILLEVMAVSRQPLHQLVESLQEEVGHFNYDRLDLPISAGGKETLLNTLADNPPPNLGSFTVSGQRMLDGIKLFLDEDGWILFRASGTEPSLRIYAEAKGKENVSRIMEEGQKLYYRVKSRGGRAIKNH